MKRQIEIDREAAQTLRRWLRQGYMVPEELPALYMTPEDEAGALMEDGTGEAEPGEAPHAGAFVAAPSDVKTLISWLENRRGVNVNVVIQTFDNVTCDNLRAVNMSKTI